MRFEIAIKTEWGDLFGSTFSWPLDGRLSVSGDYYLLHLNMDADEGLDIFKLLNQACACGLPEGYFTVDGAGFFTYAASSGGATQLPLVEAFPAAPLPTELKSGALPASQVTSFWLTANFSSFSLFGGLLQVGFSDGSLVLKGLVASGSTGEADFKKTVLYARLPDIRLFGHLDFLGVELCYTLGSARAFILRGQISLGLFGHEYAFNGALDVDERRLKAEIAADKALVIESLFGGAMPGISFKELFFTVDHLFAAGGSPSSTICGVGGQVSFGSLRLKGLLYLKGAAPVLAYIKIEQDLSVGELFRQCLPGLSWPSELIDITFRAGSRLYYLSEDPSGMVLPDTLPYQLGFNVYVSIKLRLITDFLLTGNIRVASGGISATIVMENPLDLFIFQLRGYQALEKGPRFSFSSIGKPSMGFACTFAFLQSECGRIELSCGKDDGGLTVSGKLSLSAELETVFGKQTGLALSYSAGDGLSVSGWDDFPLLYEAQRIVDRIQKIINDIPSPGKDPCAFISDLICDLALQGEVKVSPAFSSEGDQAWMGINCTYIFSSFGAKLFEVDFPKLAGFALPSSLSWRSLPGKIASALDGVLNSFVENLMNDPEKFAVIMGIAGAKQGLDFVATLLCRKVVDKRIGGAILLVMSLFHEFGGHGWTKKLFEDLSKYFDEHPDPGPDPPEPDPPEPEPPEPDPPEPDPPGQPQNLAVGFSLSGNALFFTWDTVEGADYGVSFSGDGAPLLSAAVSAPEHSFHIPMMAAYTQAAFSFRVAAVKEGQRSAESAIGVSRLSPPELSACASDGAMLKLAWGAIPNAASYDVTVILPTTKTLPDYHEQVEPCGLSLRLPPEYGTGTYRCSVRSLPPEGAAVLYSLAGTAKTCVVTCGDYAARLRGYGFSGIACGQALYADNKDIGYEEMAVAMAVADYPKEDTAAALKAVWPNITATDMARALLEAY